MYTDEVRHNRRWSGPGIVEFRRSLRSTIEEPVTIWFRQDGTPACVRGHVIEMIRLGTGDKYSLCVLSDDTSTTLKFNAFVTPRRSYTYELDQLAVGAE